VSISIRSWVRVFYLGKIVKSSLAILCCFEGFRISKYFILNSFETTIWYIAHVFLSSFAGRPKRSIRKQFEEELSFASL
jgi:hypothetical protein